MTTIVVSAALVERHGRLLVTRRLPGVHLAGCWEFPGGKCEAGETLDACLRRELREELDVDAEVGPEVFSVVHDYEGRRVELHFFRCDLRGEPAAQLGQELAWTPCADLDEDRFPPADAELVRRLRQSAGR